MGTEGKRRCRATAILALMTSVAILHGVAASQDSLATGPGQPAPQDSLATGPGEPAPGATWVALGGGFGTPAGVTAIGGVYVAPFAVRVSGGYWKTRWNGFQGDIGVLLNSSPEFAHGISIVGGVFRANPPIPDNAGVSRETSKMVHYVGAAYDACLAGLFIQIGLAHGRGDYPDPQLLVQCAYLFTF